MAAMPDTFIPSALGAAVYACDPAQSQGRKVAESESSTRTVFQRDRDRIIHSGAFRKLQYKTQVFVYHEGDYYRTRLTHSIEVAQIARSICRVLGLNEDLAETLALAHDLGHTCFGHAGEDALHVCMSDYGGFDHNDQALRIVTQLERRYADFDGLNLTWETLEGLVKHNGPVLPLRAGKHLGTTTAAFNAGYDLDLTSYASAEAQVAALADDIAYNNHDLDDGLRAGIFTIDDLRELPIVGDAIRAVEAHKKNLDQPRLIHEMIRYTINYMVLDVLAETRRRLADVQPGSVNDVRNAGKPVVAFSESFQADEKALRHFLKTHLYRHYRVNRMTSKARRIVHDLFEIFLAEPECLPPDWRAPTAEKTEQARLIADYIAGMTDRYALTEHSRLFELHSPTL
jgi:dGTPase